LENKNKKGDILKFWIQSDILIFYNSLMLTLF